MAEFFAGDDVRVGGAEEVAEGGEAASWERAS